MGAFVSFSFVLTDFLLKGNSVVCVRVWRSEPMTTNSKEHDGATIRREIRFRKTESKFEISYMWNVCPTERSRFSGADQMLNLGSFRRTHTVGRSQE